MALLLDARALQAWWVMGIGLVLVLVLVLLACAVWLGMRAAGGLHSADGVADVLRSLDVPAGAIDVTEAEEARRSSRRSEQWYQLLFDANPMPMWVVDSESLRILAANRAAVALYGYSRDEFLAMTIDALLPASVVARPDGALPFEAGDAAMWTRHFGHRTHQVKDGRLLEMEVETCDFDFDGARARLVLARDVTSQRAHEAAVRSYEAQLADLPELFRRFKDESDRRLARRVHDDIGQAIALAQLQLEASLQALRLGAPGNLDAVLRAAVVQLETASAQAREILSELRPASLDESGLVEALRRHVHVLRSLHVQTQLTLALAAGVERLRWPVGVEWAAYEVAREALTNALRHANAKAVELSIEGNDRWLCLSIDDDGRGLPEEYLRGRPGHIGVAGMHECAARAGAALVLAPRRPRGTTVTMHWREGGDGQHLHH